VKYSSTRAIESGPRHIFGRIRVSCVIRVAYIDCETAAAASETATKHGDNGFDCSGGMAILWQWQARANAADTFVGVLHTGVGVRRDWCCIMRQDRFESQKSLR